MEEPQFLINDKVIYLKTNHEEFDALLYTAMVDEVKRLRSARKLEERREIKKFILEGYQAFVKYSLEGGHQDKALINTQT